MERVGAWVRRHAVKVTVTILAVAVTLALYWQHEDNTRLDGVVQRQQQEQALKDYTDCIGRKDARDAIRELVLLLEQSPLVSDGSKEIIKGLLQQLPPIECKVDEDGS